MTDRRPTLTAQASTLRALLDRVTPHSLHKSTVARSKSEGELIIANLAAGLATIEWCHNNIEIIRRVAAEEKAS